MDIIIICRLTNERTTSTTPQNLDEDKQGFLTRKSSRNWAVSPQIIREL